MMDDTKKGADLMAILKRPLDELFRYCKENDWAGFDPYDGLNSRVYQATPLKNSKLCRIALIQALKRLPVNLRPLLMVPRLQNPKALALFLSAFVKLSKLGLLKDEGLIQAMTELLAALRSPGNRYWNWGYSFPWQTRGELVPQGGANLVCTVFVANALLDAFYLTSDPRCIEMAGSAADYLLDELYWTQGGELACFSYPLPTTHVPIHNANFMGAALLCRLAKYGGGKRYRDSALKVVRYSAARQQPDGAWGYGESPSQGWVDNFHTGYNLCALRTIGHCAETGEFQGVLRLGFDFYRKNFFRQDGAPKYYHNRIYPIDIHSVAQSIITMLELKELSEQNLPQARSVLTWALDNMWDDNGYFYYQLYPLFKNKISYMRWSQAWMLLALATFAEHVQE